MLIVNLRKINESYNYYTRQHKCLNFPHANFFVVFNIQKTVQCVIV